MSHVRLLEYANIAIFSPADIPFFFVGVYIYSNGDMYEGGYFNGEKNGYGVAVWSNGSRYEGNWGDGREHGMGRYFTASGQCYTGNFNQVSTPS